MKYTEIKNMVYANEDKTLITCDVKFESFADFIPFTASPDDSENHGRDIYAECIAGKCGEIGDYTAPVIDYSVVAELQRESLLSAANDKIKDWRTELELGIISDDDKAQLIKWMTYIKDIKSLDLTSVADKTAYDAISWPVNPE